MKKTIMAIFGLSLLATGSAFANGGSDLKLTITNTAEGAIAIGGSDGAGALTSHPFSLAVAAADDGAAYAGSVRVNHNCQCRADITIENTANHAIAIGNARAGSVFVNVGGFQAKPR